MISQRDSLLNFTDRSWNELYEVVDDPRFSGCASRQIYEDLIKDGRIIPFCDYLKRFLYINAGLSGSYQDIPTAEYQSILRSSFYETQTPVSLDDVTCRFSAVSANWLKQNTVSRDTVLLLGFGLALSLSEVNDFFLKALHTEALRDADPKELIAAYCYDHAFSYPTFEALWERYKNSDLKEARDAEEAVLFDQLKKLNARKAVPGEKNFQMFLKLYRQTQLTLAEDYDRSAFLGYRPFRADHISPADIEAMLYEGVPFDENDNLLPLKASSLYGIFSNRRLTRKRIRSLLQRELPVDRSDLITLNFFIWSRSEMQNQQKRYIAFAEDTNRLLLDSGFGELYAALPYERFLMMCMLTDDPLQTYTDVWERSYQTAVSERL